MHSYQKYHISKKYHITKNTNMSYPVNINPAAAILGAGIAGYWLGKHKITGIFGPVKTKRYSTIQHWYNNTDKMLEWDKLPLDARQPEWFCWQEPGESMFGGFSYRRFWEAHIRPYTTKKH